MKDGIILIGGGGHAAACVDVLRLAGKFPIAGIIDPVLKTGTECFGYPVLGGDADLPALDLPLRQPLGPARTGLSVFQRLFSGVLEPFQLLEFQASEGIHQPLGTELCCWI